MGFQFRSTWVCVRSLLNLHIQHFVPGLSCGKEESPISAREKDLIDKEKELVQFENMVREAVRKAEAVR